MSAEAISFEIQVECARRRDEGVGAKDQGKNEQAEEMHGQALRLRETALKSIPPR